MKLVLFAFKSFIRRGHRNLLAIIVLAFGLAIFFVGNAILVGGAAGLTTVYKNSLIGDGAIGFNDPQPVSIWGYEELFSSQFTKIPNLPAEGALFNKIKDNPALHSITPLVASAALLEIGSVRNPIYVMGTEAASFFPNRTMRFINGAPPQDDGQPWIIISQGICRQIGKTPKIGEELQITYADSNGFKIRAIQVAGVVEFPVQNSALDSLCFVDINSAWDLFGLAHNKDLKVETTSQTKDDLDDMFSEGDVIQQPSSTQDWNSQDIATLIKPNADAKKRPVEGDFHFILFSLNPGYSVNQFLSSIKTDLAEHEARLMGWQEAAGQSLRYVVNIQRIFNVGMLLFTILIIMIFINTVSNSIMERQSEIGILRALGARRKKVALVFSVEYLLVGLISFAVAWVLGAISVAILNRLQIQLNNEVLVNLFGGSILRAQLSTDLVLVGIVLSLALPLFIIVLMSGRLAGISPRQAMQNGT